MGRYVNLKGKRFGKLLVLSQSRTRSKWGHRLWNVKCDCGTKQLMATFRLTSYKLACCNLCSDAQHGFLKKYPREYQSWSAMKNRCLNSNGRDFKYWGGRGIRICPQWLGPGGFVQFVADMGRRPEGRSLDRENVEGNYEPSNCRWSTAMQQGNNRRNNYSPEELKELRKKAIETNPNLTDDATEFEVEMATF
jgi:hypothetical protein